MPRTSHKPKRPELPTSLLSELSSSSDSRGSPYARPGGGKGGKPSVSRKEARKQQRTEKKQRKATHHARLHEKPTGASPAIGQGAKHPTTKTQAAPDAKQGATKVKQQEIQQKTVTADKQKKTRSQPTPSTTPKKPQLTDQEKMLKLAKKDPALLASLRSQGLIPSTAGLSDGEMGRDEAIDRMDIARYEKLLKLNKRKRGNKKKKQAAATDGDQHAADDAPKPASVPKSIAHDGLGDLFAMVGGVTSKGEVSVVANPTVQVESDGEPDADADDDDEEDGGDDMLGEMGDDSDSDSAQDMDDASGDGDESMDEDDFGDSDQDESDCDISDMGDDDHDVDDDKYLAGLGLDDLEGMLGGGDESDDDGKSSDDDDNMEMDSDLEAEMREILARPEYAAGGLDSFGEDDSESGTDEGDHPHTNVTESSDSDSE